MVEQMHAALTSEHRTYLREQRMLSDEVIDRYRLGMDEQGGGDRVTIPVADAKGVYRDVRRWLPIEKRRQGTAKMLHWTQGYGGARLFPIDQLEHDVVVLVEGELDALACISHGIPAITATTGALYRDDWGPHLARSSFGAVQGKGRGDSPGCRSGGSEGRTKESAEPTESRGPGARCLLAGEATGGLGCDRPCTGPRAQGNFRTLRRLIDPSILETLTFPHDVNELVQKLSHHWAPLFDSATTLPLWLSDALCRAVTGEGFSKRALYTDDEDQIYHFQRCLGLNGINIVATRADLLDRSILIGLERIAPAGRRTKALQIKPAVQLEHLPRMADFACWGCAIARALGYNEVDFLNAYEGNRRTQNAEVLEGYPVAAAIMGLMVRRPEWQGEPAELLQALDEVAERERINTPFQPGFLAGQNLEEEVLIG